MFGAWYEFIECVSFFLFGYMLSNIVKDFSQSKEK